MKHAKLISLFVALFALTLLAGCATVVVDLEKSDMPMSMNNPDDGEVIKHFKIQKKIWYVLLRAIPVSDPQIQTLVEAEVEKAGGSGAVNITVQGQDDAIDVIVNMFVGLIVAPRTVTIEGDILR